MEQLRSASEKERESEEETRKADVRPLVREKGHRGQADGTVRGFCPASVCVHHGSAQRPKASPSLSLKELFSRDKTTYIKLHH